MVTGATADYLVGFVVAAFVIGALAERRQDLINDPSTPPTKPFYGTV